MSLVLATLVVASVFPACFVIDLDLSHQYCSCSVETKTEALELISISEICECASWFWLLIAFWNRGLAVGEGENGEPEGVRRATADWDGVGEKPSVFRDVDKGDDE